MPIFDFTCDQCDHTFEKLVMNSASALPNCVSCQSDKVTKQVSAPTFRLAGSGWYETDFKTGNKKNLASSNDASVSSESASGDSAEKSDKGNAAKESNSDKSSSEKGGSDKSTTDKSTSKSASVSKSASKNSTTQS